MAININGILVRYKDEYLNKGVRQRLNSTMRKDLFNEYKELMDNLNKPMSIGFDCFIELLQQDEVLLESFAKKVLKY